MEQAHPRVAQLLHLSPPSRRLVWTDNSKSVSFKNVVYREIFNPHSQIESMEDIDEICSLLNDTFPSSQIAITSPLLDIVTPAKRESVLSDTRK